MNNQNLPDCDYRCGTNKDRCCKGVWIMKKTPYPESDLEKCVPSSIDTFRRRCCSYPEQCDVNLVCSVNNSACGDSYLLLAGDDIEALKNGRALRVDIAGEYDLFIAYDGNCAEEKRKD